MVVNRGKRNREVEQIPKNGLSSDCRLQLACMKSELLVIADSIDRPVITGPIDGAAIGNLLAQAMALGDITTMDELRTVVRRSEAVSTYEPHHTPEWEATYQKLLSFSK